MAWLLVLASVAGAGTPVAPSPFTLDSRWTLEFRQAGTGRSVERTTFTIVSVERVGRTDTGFGLVAGQLEFSVLTALDGTDGTLTVTDLTPPGDLETLRVCAFGTARPPLHSGLTLTVPAALLPEFLAGLRKKLLAVRASRPRSAELALLRAAAGQDSAGTVCTLRRAR